MSKNWNIIDKGKDVPSLEKALSSHLEYTLGEDQKSVTERDVFLALANVVRDLLTERWIHTQRTYRHQGAKRVYYLSMEFLIGRLLSDSLLSLNILDEAREVIQNFGFDLDHVLDEEMDAGLGNGGLGRLAACFLDSMATLQLPSFGYGIRYEFGLFKQKFVDGSQVEEPDNWLSKGDPWEIMRPKIKFHIKFFGRTEEITTPEGRKKTIWKDTQDIHTIPYDILVPGYKNDTVNTLRLWSAHATDAFDLQFFNDGNYTKAWERIVVSENISKVLYPKDDTLAGKELRLKQEYFFSSASIQDILRRHLRENKNFDNLAEKVAIQLNDTHPAIGVPELMRLLIDEYDYEWDQAWDITTNTIAYTNHTLMSEALEKWSIELLGNLLPRHLEIIYKINDLFLKRVSQAFPNDMDRIRRVSIIEEDHGRNVRMAHLAIVGSHAINGVARIHSNLLKSNTFKDFYEIMPTHFTNKTNGITQRRWLLKTNPELSTLITEHIGPEWVDDLFHLRELLPLADDKKFGKSWRAVKNNNKKRLAQLIKERHHIEVSTESIFDCQIKRMHEYKRQHLNILQVIAHYMDLKRGTVQNKVPRTVLFGGKAAPGYFMAKLIIRLINDVANVINNDQETNEFLKVIFLENYNVTLAEKIFAAADLSEQISTAGTEASGTGNMKFCLNGALTIGTMDGANVEICEEVGRENIFIFGMETDEVAALRQKGYHPSQVCHQGSAADEALSLIADGAFSNGDKKLFSPFIEEMRDRDTYLALADFDHYATSQRQVEENYLDQDSWTRKSIINVAHSGKFSSDRTIRDYAQEIWKLKPIKIDLKKQIPS